jgi:L-seryl-tRNA(Ser) seleniumtransferase
MKESGCKMVEIGTTNKTHLSDYENAITDRTAILFKTHKSNFSITGFTEEPAIEDLVELARKNNLIIVYDLGSGLIKSNEKFDKAGEPNVESLIKKGVDVVAFSGDKLLGGPQAGIICGIKEQINKISKAPLMRALRVNKMTLFLLNTVLRNYMDEKKIVANIPFYKFINRKESELLEIANSIAQSINSKKISVKIIKSQAEIGGGSLPNYKLSSYAVTIKPGSKNPAFPKSFYLKLLQAKIPIAGIVRNGEFMIDVFCLFSEDLPDIVNSINEIS